MSDSNISETFLQEAPHLFQHAGLSFCERPLSKLTKPQAYGLIDKLYSPEERFAQGFYKYKVDVLKHPEELAWANTLEELDHYKTELKSNLSDPCVFTVGTKSMNENDTPVYTPVGIYCMRPLAEHPRGPELQEALNKLTIHPPFDGQKSIVHSFSLLKEFRNLAMLKYIFIAIGIKALKQQVDHLFFFMSDYRLKSIYTRYGLIFPDNLKFKSSEHVIGCYSLVEANILKLMQEFDQLS